MWLFIKFLIVTLVALLLTSWYDLPGYIAIIPYGIWILYEVIRRIISIGSGSHSSGYAGGWSDSLDSFDSGGDSTD